MTLGIQRDPLSGAIRSNIAATGSKRYGAAGLGAATRGRLPAEGYEDREARKRARRQALQRRMQQESQGGLATPLGGQLY